MTTTETVRMAKCTCGKEVPSTPSLLRTTAEQWAKDRCAVCCYALGAHSPESRVKPHMRRAMGDGHEFVPTPPDARDYDTYYCGCRGWD